MKSFMPEIWYHHADGGGTPDDYHNLTDDRINKQIGAVKILVNRNAKPDLFTSYLDEIDTLLYSANNQVSLLALGIRPKTHNEEVRESVRKILPETLKSAI